MAARVLAIALDAADWQLIRRFAGEGLLPNLKAIADQGAFRALENQPLYSNESPWVSLLTGCLPGKTGYWTPLRYAPRGYRVGNGGAYSFAPYQPFFALAPGRRVTMFDLPHCGRLFPAVDGVQVLGWGAHSPMCGGRSQPAGLLAALRRRFGPHPALRTQDRGSWWDGGRLRRLHVGLLEGVRRRGAILRALRREHPADLSLLAFSEIHIAGHHFWHLSDPAHPAFGRNNPPLPDLLLDIYRETDRELGRLLDGMAADENLLVFSPEGGAANCYDLNSMVFLPEILFRWNFPGRTLFRSPGGDDGAAAAIAVPRIKDWPEALWNDHYSALPPHWLPRPLRGIARRAAAVPGCRFPFYLLRRLGALQWQPATWYRPWWPAMKAFALPSYGDGCIRVNLRGREPQGIVSPQGYDALCRELSERLLALRDPRSGKPLVREVIRTRAGLAGVEAGRLPDADLVVLWERQANDMVEDTEAGRLGPAPFWKTGSHQPTGFVIGLGPGIARSAPRGQGRVVDLAPTVLELLGADADLRLDGRSLFRDDA
jgi:predicted AlkP superfamily phosphohydrolase/phosphomutase